MSEAIKHECGVAMIRLLKPLEYYKEKYGTWMYGINKLYLLMEKQHNRGQDGAGMVSLKIDNTPGQVYLDRLRSVKVNPIKDIFDQIFKIYGKSEKREGEQFFDPHWAKQHLPFCGEA